jgi:hypothetical protein
LVFWRFGGPVKFQRCIDNVLSIVFQLEFISLVCGCSLLRNVCKLDR